MTTVISALNENTRLALFQFSSPISFARPLAYLEHFARARAQNLLESADHHTALAGRVLKQTQRFAVGLGRLGVVDGRREQIWSIYWAVSCQVCVSCAAGTKAEWSAWPEH